MAEVMPPPSGRFDPVTGLWATLGGPLPDPQRDANDPDRRESVVLVGPIPVELSETEAELEISQRQRQRARAQGLRYAFLTMLAVSAALVVFGAQLRSCFDVDNCSIAWPWGPGWILVGALTSLVAFAGWRVLSLWRKRPH